MCAPSCATEIDLPLTRAVDLTPESQALLDSSVGSAGYVFDYEAVESTTFSKTTTTLQVNQTLGTRVSVVTFPLCAPAHRSWILYPISPSCPFGAVPRRGYVGSSPWSALIPLRLLSDTLVSGLSIAKVSSKNK